MSNTLPLRIQIFSFLLDNNGQDSYIDIKPHFNNFLSTLDSRRKFRQTLSILNEDKYIELDKDSKQSLKGIASTHLDNKYAENPKRVLRSVSSLKIICRLKQAGVNALKEFKMENNPIEIIIKPDSKLFQLKELFDDILWEKCSSNEFILFWGLGSKIDTLKIKDKKQTAFVYLLCELLKLNYTQVQLAQTFNIKDFDNKLSRAKKSNSDSLKEISNILKQAKFSLK